MERALPEESPPRKILQTALSVDWLRVLLGYAFVDCLLETASDPFRDTRSAGPHSSRTPRAHLHELLGP
eukprot:828640-Pyramimonas_sp.AAC.1